MGKTLGDLKVVTVRFEGSKLNIKGETTFSWYLLYAGGNLERMFHEFAGRFI
jgi:hypothetical protein